MIPCASSSSALPPSRCRRCRRCARPGFSVPLVVTQPDRPVGRRSEPQPTAVAARAAEWGLSVEKPARVRDNAALLARLEAAAPDAIAVVAFGRILPPAILELPRLGCVNVHASLLPRYRGASPIQAAIAAGDAETGVVTMRVVEELDAGPLYLSKTVAIGPRETAGELSRAAGSRGRPPPRRDVARPPGGRSRGEAAERASRRSAGRSAGRTARSTGRFPRPRSRACCARTRPGPGCTRLPEPSGSRSWTSRSPPSRRGCRGAGKFPARRGPAARRGRRRDHAGGRAGAARRQEPGDGRRARAQPPRRTLRAAATVTT